MDTPDKIQIKVTIPGGFQHDGVFYSEGDVSTEMYVIGEYFIRAGWAEDTAGNVPSCTPDKSEIILAPENVIFQVRNEVA